MPRNRMYMSLIVSAAMIALATSPAHAVTPEEAFAPVAAAGMLRTRRYFAKSQRARILLGAHGF